MSAEKAFHVDSKTGIVITNTIVGDLWRGHLIFQANVHDKAGHFDTANVLVSLFINSNKPFLT